MPLRLRTIFVSFGDSGLGLDLGLDVPAHVSGPTLSPDDVLYSVLVVAAFAAIFVLDSDAEKAVSYGWPWEGTLMRSGEFLSACPVCG